MHRKKTGIRFSAGFGIAHQARLCHERPARAGADDEARNELQLMECTKQRYIEVN